MAAHRDGARRAAAHLWRRLITAVAALACLPATATDLPTAWQSALAADANVAAAVAMREAAQQGIGVAKGRLRPQVTLQSTQQQLEQTTITGEVSSPFRGTTSSTVLQVRQALYRPRDWHGLGITELQAEQAEWRVRAAQADLFNRLAGVWIDVLGAHAQWEIERRGLAAAEAVERQAAEQWQSGEGTRDAAVEAAAQVAAARAQWRDGQGDLEAKQFAYEQVSRLSAGPLATLALPSGDNEVELATDGGDFVERMLSVNHDLAAARLDEQISQRRLVQAGADHRPTLDLIGSHAEAANDTTNTLGSRYRNNAVGLQFVLPIFAGGAVNASQRQAAATLVAAEAATQAIVHKLRTQAVADLAAVAGLRQRIGAARLLVDAAREQHKAVQARVLAGSKSLGDLSAADQTVTRREADLVALQVQRIKLQARLLALLPGGDPEPLRWAGALSERARP